MRYGKVLVVCVALVVLGRPVQAGLLDISPHGVDIFADCMDVSYDAATDAFSVYGYPATIDLDGSDGSGDSIFIDEESFGEYILEATIDESGILDLTASGTIEITGTVSELSYNSGTLLTGTLTAFSPYYAPGNPTSGFFEFLFDITGGDAAGIYGPGGGLILYMGPNNNGYDGFASDTSFDNFDAIYGWGDGYSDTFAQPEPATFSLLTLGLLAIRLQKRKTKTL